MLSGDAIPIDCVGHIRSPKLKEMNPTSGIGWSTYGVYIYFMKIDTIKLRKIVDGIQDEDAVFDVVIRDESLRSLYCNAFSFFMLETVEYYPDRSIFVAFAGDGESKRAVGVITKENFDTVRGSILLLNYITQSKLNVSVEYASDMAMKLWEMSQEFLASQEKKREDETMALGNIISKLCAIHPSYNFLNVYELTVFQMYDAFFQSCYMRSIAFSESIVSNHGSKEFKYDDWMNPVKNYE